MVLGWVEERSLVDWGRIQKGLEGWDGQRKGCLDPHLMRGEEVAAIVEGGAGPGDWGDGSSDAMIW